MKRTKRLSSVIISFLLVVSMIMPSFSVIAYAVSSPTLSIDSKTVNQGEEFTVAVKIQNAANSVYNGNFTLQYDNSKLEAVSYTYGSIFNDHTRNCNLNYQSTGNQIRFTFSGAYALKQDGTLVNITFKSKENISGTAELTFTANKMYDETGVYIDTAFSNGNVTVTSKPTKTLTSVSVQTNPTKTTYYIGESLDTSGLTLKLTYSDASTETVSSGFTTGGFSSATAGTKTINVKYGGLTTTFTVTVNSASVTPDPTDYDVTVTLEAPSKLIVGKEFTLNVYIEGSYDGYSFEIPKYTAFTYQSSAASNSSVKVDEKSDRLIVSIMPGLELTDSPKTLIVSVTYTVNQNADVGNMNLNIENAKITNEFGDIITSVFIDEKSVEIVKRIPGDINGDDVFDYTDVAKLYAYFRGKTTIDDGINIDFNNDGTFDYTDVAKLYAIFRGKSTF